MIKKILKVIGLLILYILVFCIAFFVVRVWQADGNVKEAAIGVLQDVADKITNAEPIYVLVVGVSTDIEKELSDTIMLAGYNPKTQEAFMVSIPRDTFVGDNINKVRAKDKINSLYGDTGVASTVAAVEQISGIDIDYYVTVKTEMLVEIVDTIGGVEFDVPMDMYYNDKTQDLHINLKKGKQIIDGEKAEQLLRFRHNDDGSSYSYEYGDNDFGRMRTQREFIKATLEQCIEVNDLEKLTEIAKTVFNYVETDIELSYAISYLAYLYDFSTDNLIMEQLPGVSEKSPNGVWIYNHDEVKSQELFNQIVTEFNTGNLSNHVSSENVIDNSLENVTDENLVNEIN